MIKIIDLLNETRKTFSVEVFPPKTQYAFESVCNAAEEIEGLAPLFMSVTYGAGGGTSQYTVKLAEMLQEKAKNENALRKMPVLAHLTCISSDRSTVGKRIYELHCAGIHNIMALRGDIPQDRMNEDRSNWDYRHASELIKELKDSGYDFCIGGACYPEMHPESANKESDIDALKLKIDSGCDFLTTQMFFDNEVFYRFLDSIAAKGINVPVLPGIMPITSSRQVERIVRLSGCSLPETFTHMIAKYSDDSDSMYKAGIEYAVNQIRDLYASGVKNIHIYSMNNPKVAAELKKSIFA